ncbi:cobalamin (vitamin B12) biosynthesis CbiM protein [Desulfarculus baarsii DSM 2075]|uniref:Cobalamin (Vitamin B12) biosynthesis CbiM protein n=1 Tax=Desulfarculus baarsii (strain ATCC 33931 / DSM 2075 / LMG 7858 / VKM B-1802 / 2st14) TaxID=644282 RepID=E1QHG6_DESB2|nr:cobalt transporter CbiM [Desulfarculus baarsii]ADK85009.1 cobalamin (vitamin B12) biosynthesis CbiM protein [Desulfarculus baarsii DSM 2075]
MHIADGVLSGPVLAAGAALSAGGTAWGLRKINVENLPRTGLLAAAFFVASLVHVPVGPSSVHLLLNGLVGIMLGWAAFPAILVALTLQAILFQFGGLTVLGVNTLNVALPAIFCHYLLARPVRGGSRLVCMLSGFSAGALSVMLTAAMTALSLYLSGDSFISTAQALLVAHLPVAAIEGVFTALVVAYLRQVRSQALGSLLI